MLRSFVSSVALLALSTQAHAWSQVGEKTRTCTEVTTTKTATWSVKGACATAPDPRGERTPTYSFVILTQSDADAEAAYEKSLKDSGALTVFLDGSAGCENLVDYAYDTADSAPRTLPDNDAKAHPMLIQITSLNAQPTSCQ